jgi:hypothetical protein
MTVGSMRRVSASASNNRCAWGRSSARNSGSYRTAMNRLQGIPLGIAPEEHWTAITVAVGRMLEGA